MVEVNVDKFYSNRALYPFIPEAVFDALEAAYLSGNECARIPEGEYNTMMSNLKRANLCPYNSQAFDYKRRDKPPLF